jgi:hypothetical protein
MYCDMDVSRMAWARIILSMLADQPNSPVTREQGEPTIRSEMTTFSTLDSLRRRRRKPRRRRLLLPLSART